MKIKILSPGKTKEPWLIDAIEEYSKRLSSYTTIELIFSKDEKKFYEQLSIEKHLILLDPLGKTYTSEDFSKFLFQQIEKGGAQVSFAIGGPEGFPQVYREKYPLLSLSKMTFTHQMARLILLEQIFRAFEIDRGSQYHK